MGEIVEDEEGVDVTHLHGAGRMTDAELKALRRYQDWLRIAGDWPDVENFRACVKAYDELVSMAKGQYK